MENRTETTIMWLYRVSVLGPGLSEKLPSVSKSVAVHVRWSPNLARGTMTRKGDYTRVCLSSDYPNAKPCYYAI